MAGRCQPTNFARTINWPAACEPAAGRPGRACPAAKQPGHGRPARTQWRQQVDRIARRVSRGLTRIGARQGMKAWGRALFGLSALLTSVAQAGYLDEWAGMKGLVPRGYVCFRATNSIVPDGRLTEPTWQAAPWTLEFLPITAQTNILRPIRGRAKLLWSSAHLYVGVALEPRAVLAGPARADAPDGSRPELRLVLDPDGDGHGYLELAVSATGAVRLWLYDKPPKDGGRPQALPQSSSERIVAASSSAATRSGGGPAGWAFELAIPWQALAPAGSVGLPEDREQWRINIGWAAPTPLLAGGRAGPQTGQLLWVWSPHGVADLHRPERWAYLQFSRKRGTRAPFIPDPGLAARNALQGLYYAQKDFHARHGRWAVSLTELGYRFEPEPGLEHAPVIRLTPEGFEATIDGPMQGLRPLRWHISHDGRFWADPELRLQIRRYYQSLPDSLAEP